MRGPRFLVAMVGGAAIACGGASLPPPAQPAPPSDGASVARSECNRIVQRLDDFPAELEMETDAVAKMRLGATAMRTFSVGLRTERITTQPLATEVRALADSAEQFAARTSDAVTTIDEADALQTRIVAWKSEMQAAFAPIADACGAQRAERRAADCESISHELAAMPALEGDAWGEYIADLDSVVAGLRSARVADGRLAGAASTLANVIEKGRALFERFARHQPAMTRAVRALDASARDLKSKMDAIGATCLPNAAPKGQSAPERIFSSSRLHRERESGRGLCFVYSR